MQNMLKSKTFWFTSIIAAAVIFLAGINSDKIYKSEVKILFVPKSEMAALNISRIIRDAEEIFPLKIKNAEIETSEESDIASVFAEGESRLETEARTFNAARGIAVEMSRYYDIRKDLNIRIISDPDAKQKMDFFSIGWMLFGIVGGFIAGVLIWLMRNLKQSMSFDQNYYKILIIFKDVFSKFKSPLNAKFRSFAPMMRNEISRDKVFQESVMEIEKETDVSIGKKASAPDNLPIGDGFILPVKKSENIEESEPRHEATPEEVKERLNKLLRGEM